MSTNPSLVGRGMAAQVVDYLVARLGLVRLENEPDDRRAVGVVGSLRRGRQAIGDIDLIAPMPKDDLTDYLRSALLAAFSPAKPPTPPKPTQAALFAPPPPPRADALALLAPGEAPLGQVVRGGSEMFRLVRLQLKSGPVPGMCVEIHRYDPGPTGNRGWIEMIRTGPAEFAHALVTRWQFVRAKPGEQGSRDGYPLDAGGSRVPIPDEHEAFRRLYLGYIPPHEREDAIAKVQAMTRHDFGVRRLA